MMIRGGASMIMTAAAWRYDTRGIGLVYQTRQGIRGPMLDDSGVAAVKAERTPDISRGRTGQPSLFRFVGVR